MIKCFYTGVKLNEDEAYVLDLRQARELLRELQNKAFAVQKMIKELGQIDKVEIFNPRDSKKITQRRRRLICKQLASAFSISNNGKDIFIRWSEWVARRSRNNKQQK